MCASARSTSASVPTQPREQSISSSRRAVGLAIDARTLADQIGEVSFQNSDFDLRDAAPILKRVVVVASGSSPASIKTWLTEAATKRRLAVRGAFEGALCVPQLSARRSAG